MERWATFDCYGTLIDWDGGVGDELARLWGEDGRARLLARYHEVEPLIQAGPGNVLSYRQVLTEALARIATAEGLVLPVAETAALARSLPRWAAFAEVSAALREARARGWRLAILSNTDRDYIEASLVTIGVPFDEVIVAGEIGSYKPAPGHWQVFTGRTGAAPAGHVHVGRACSTMRSLPRCSGCRWCGSAGLPSGRRCPSPASCRRSPGLPTHSTRSCRLEAPLRQACRDPVGLRRAAGSPG